MADEAHLGIIDRGSLFCHATVYIARIEEHFIYDYPHQQVFWNISMALVATPKWPALFCSFAVVVAAVLTVPFADVGMNDDWSYIWSAKVLAQTGHIIYVGWASAMLGWQLVLGALFIKLFGFSFFVPRASTICLAAALAYIFQRTCVRCGLAERTALFATLTFVLSPLSLPLSTSFMSDVPGVLCIVACLYLCLRSLDAQTTRASFIWLTAADAVSVIGGTARQTAWLGALIMVPSAFWLIRRKRPVLVLATVMWLISLLAIVTSLRWFAHQLYSLHESAIVAHIDRDVVFGACANIGRALVEVLFLLLPITIAFIRLVPYRNKALVVSIASSLLLTGIMLVVLGHSYPPERWLVPFDLFGNYVSPRGLVDMPEIGIQPLVLSAWMQGIITIITFVAAGASLAFLLNGFRSKQQTAECCSMSKRLSWKQLLILIGPFTLGYCVLLLHRALFSSVFDRYLLPLLPFALICLIRFYQEHVDSRVSVASATTLVLLAFFGLAGTHDVFAVRRAKLKAAARLSAAGVPRTSFYGGYEYDGWTQLEAMGFANTSGILMSDGVHSSLPIPRYMRLKPCDYYFAFMVPAIQPHYGISFDAESCDGPSEFAPITFRSWLPPFHREMYIRRVTRPAF